jgi:IMP dehydrogenase
MYYMRKEDFMLRECLTFDDVLLVPAYSDVLPCNANVQTRLTRKININIPIVSAAMDTVTEARMAIAIARIGGIGIIHKNLSPNEQANEVEKVKRVKNNLLVGAAIGPSVDRQKRTELLVSAGVDILVIDTAHGHSKGVIDAVRATKAEWPNIDVIAGNVATQGGTRALIEAGADAVKVGIGPGSICTTRIISGVGVPQITAINDCSIVADEYGIPVIADGGIRHSGDITKAIAAGASSVMIGSLFAGTDEAPGEIVLYQGRSYKAYRGMGSIGAMKLGSKDRYGQIDTANEKLVPEGIEGLVPNRGSLEMIVHQMLGGLRSGMGYTGSSSINELRANSNFIRITSNGLRESHVHDVFTTEEAPNYHS